MKSLISVVLCLFALAGCGEKIEPGTRDREHPALTGITTAEVTASALAGVESYTATVESVDRAVLTARTDGRVAEIAVREGELVAKGDLLLTISENQAADRLREAEATIAEARQQLASARSRLELAQKTHARYQRLFRHEAATAQEMDQVAAELDLTRQGVSAAEAAVRRAESARGAAMTAVAWTRLTAPYDARVVRREVEEGSTVMPGTPLLVLDRRGGWSVRAQIPEARARRVEPGTPVRIEVPAAGAVYVAEVSDVLPAADPGSRTIEVKAGLPAEADLVSGLFARMVFPGSSTETILVPASAVVHRGQLAGVYLVRDGILQFRLIKTGRQAGEQVEVLSGLDPGDTIVVEGTEGARSGARVEG